MMKACTQTMAEGSEEDEEEMDMDIKEDEEKHMSAHILSDTEEGMALNRSESQFQNHPLMLVPANTSVGARRFRPLEEKERTKLRERHRRAITARILAGLRRHGNYNLRVRADINDVISALAREAGWVVLPDGTTFPARTQDSRAVPGTSSIAPIVKRPSPGKAPEFHFLPCFPTNSAEFEEQIEKNDNVMKEEMTPERDFSETSNVPVYVMLPVRSIHKWYFQTFSKREIFLQLRVINLRCEMVDKDGLLKQLRTLKSADIDGVVVEVWWGIVEPNAPQEYNWSGYSRLFQMVRDLQLKLQVFLFSTLLNPSLPITEKRQIALSFHEHGGNTGEDFNIPLPHWVTQIGVSNPDIFFTDRDGRRNGDCLSWGVDKERLFRGRTALEVYFDFMRSLRVEFDEYFVDGTITMVEIGLGPFGEMRYPSFPVKHGWRYPGVGAFQCYDQYMMKGLRKVAESRGKVIWARGPDNAGGYNSLPSETGFFCDGGDYNSHYGRFFLNWYSQVLVDHVDHMLSLANFVFEGTKLSAKLSGVYWWYKTSSHAAELTAGFYNSANRDGYAAIALVLVRHGAVLNLLWNEDRPSCHVDAFPDSHELQWQVLNAAWDVSLPLASGNAFPCHDRTAYNSILEYCKPSKDADQRHLLSFTYNRVGPALLEGHNLVEFQRFARKMHGKL